MNKKLAFIVASFLIVSLAQVACTNSYGYIQNFWNSKQVQEHKLDKIYSDKHLNDLIHHNLGVLSEKPEDQLSKEFIQKFGKQNIFDPVYLNYIFVIESQLSQLQRQENFKQNGIPIKLDVCGQNNTNTQQCILNRLFDKANNQSLVNKLKQLYGDEQHRNIAYLYATKPDVYFFKDYILQLDHLTNGAIQISESMTGSNLKLPGTLESCVNQIESQKFYFDLVNNKIFDNKNGSIAITEQNKDAILNFMKDICSMNQLSKLIRKEQQPDIFSFHITSIAQLEKVLSQDDMFKIYQIWNISYEKFIQNVQKVFKNNEISGQLIFAQPSQKQSNDVDQHKFFQLEQNKNKTTVAKRRILQSGSNISNTSKPDSQVFIWLFLFLAFVLFFAVLALLQMEFDRDSLLYAKFIATDYK